jgi:tetratricopeptide (TPR) repeat protein
MAPARIDRRWLGIFALLALALAAWSGSIVRGGFALDDREILFDSPVVEGDLPWTAAFDRDYWHHIGDAGHWRPSALLSLRVDRALWGERAAGYHATNVLLHLLVVGLAACLTQRALKERWPWIGLAVFAAHPILADSVAWISGRTSMLCAAGGLVGALLVQRSSRPSSACCAAALGLALALCGKEEGVAFAALYVALGAARSRQLALACAAGSALAICAWLFARGYALGSFFPEAPHAPLAGTPLGERLAVGGAAVGEALRLLVAPIRYAPTTTVAELRGPGFPVRAALGWGVLLVLVVNAALALRRDRRSTSAVSGLLIGAAALPYLQLVPAGEVFAPRFLYLPLLFAAPLVHSVLRRAVPGPRSASIVFPVLAACAVGFAWRTANNYASRGAYRQAVLRVRPTDARSWNDLGLSYEEEGKLERAREAWFHAARIDPDYGRPWSNLGRVAFVAGDLEAAREALERAVRLGPANPVAHVNLGSVHLRADEPHEAAALFGRATELAPGLAAAWRGLGQARLAAGDAALAIEALEIGQALAPRDRVIETLLERARHQIAGQ